MTVSHLYSLISLAAALVILIFPKTLNYALALYLVIVGLIGILALGGI